jgi:hypothetical protein
VEGEWKMLADFVVLIKVVSVSKTWQNKQLHDVLFPTIITKEILGRNVAFLSFVSKIATIVTRR